MDGISRPTGRRLESIALVVSAPFLLGFVAIAFGLMPERFFERACAVGESAGTRIACYGFMWNAVTTGIFIGLIGPLVGTYLVHREMALIGETLAHTAFAGVAFGTLVLGASGWETPLLLTALGAAVVGAVGVQLLADRTDAHGDVPVAIVLTGSFAVGALFLDLGGGFAFVDINSYLFGSISITDDRSVALMAILTGIVVGTVATTYKQLLFITFDPRAARVARLPVSRYNGLLVVLTALVVVGAMQILGVILVAAMLIVPVAAASQIADSFRGAMTGSIVVGELSVLGGLALSWQYSLRPGATIVVIAIGVYLVAVAITTVDRRAISPR